MPTVTGVGPDGSFYAGKISATKKVPAYEYDQHADESLTFFQYALWTSLKISLKLYEIQQRITEKGESLRSSESWAPHLDKALRGGIREAGTNHLLKGHKGFRLFNALFINVHSNLMDAAGVSLFDAISGNFDPHIPTASELAFEAGFTFVWWTLYAKFVDHKERKQEKGYRLSLLPGYEIDRAVALQLLSRTLPLIKPTDLNDQS